MRDILFRGKRVDNGEWVEGFYWTNGLDNHFIRVYQQNSMFTIIDFEVDEHTVGQYTGLADANGAKIFEGDVLSFIDTRWNDDGNDVEEYTAYCFVKYGQFNCSCCSGVYGWCFDGGDIRRVRQYTVVGNIYDNADLLPQKEEYADIQEPQLTEAKQTVLAETYMRALVDTIKPNNDKGEG